MLRRATGNDRPESVEPGASHTQRRPARPFACHDTFLPLGLIVALTDFDFPSPRIFIIFFLLSASTVRACDAPAG